MVLPLKGRQRKLTDIKTDQLVQYNVFGYISVSPRAIAASATAAIGDRLISRSVIRDMTGEPPLPGMDKDESTAVTFGAMIKPGDKTHITAHEVGVLRSGASIAELPEIRKIASEALSQLRTALK